jgi:hypothetical protein
MSYAFSIRKAEGTLQFVNDAGTLEAIAAHIPDGAVFTIQGHNPSPDTSTVGSLNVQLSTDDGDVRTYRASASTSYNTEPAGTATKET